ncbi:MAG: NAD(P)/FAD-dependent oxidoreductase [Polyangiaceae bacterium]
MTDVIVIGSGPNGLVSAVTLARAGLSVLVLESANEPGGAVRTLETTLPGFKHDIGAGFFPFGRSSPALVPLELGAAGLAFENAAIESAHPARDGSVGAICRDLARAEELLGVDGEVFTELVRFWRGAEATLLPALLAPFPPIREGLRVPPSALLRLARVALSSGRGLAESLFQTEAARRMFPALALHTDVGPDDALGAVVGFMLGVTATSGGFAVPRGGAGAITRALLTRLKESRGVVITGERVRRVVVEGRARAVETARGRTYDASTGIIAATAAPTLYLELLGPRVVPTPILEQMRSFKRGFGTFKVDWALDGPVPWTARACREAAVVHTGESNDDLARFTREVRAGSLPRDPYLVLGQQSLVDPSRAPEGKHTLYCYSRVPSEPAGGWSGDARREMLARIETRIEELAPGFRERILGRAVFAPPDLERMNENLLGGDLGGGTAAITNQLLFRPILGYGRRTPIARLYLGSSYAHPGAGVHGMAGLNAARALLRDAS